MGSPLRLVETDDVATDMHASELLAALRDARTADLQALQRETMALRLWCGEDVLCTARVTVDQVSIPAEGIDLRATLAAMHSRYISEALRMTGGNRAAAARLLGIPRATLLEQAQRLGVI